MITIRDLISGVVKTKTMFKLFPSIKAEIMYQIFWGDNEKAFSLKRREVYTLVNNDIVITSFDKLDSIDSL